MLKQTALKYAPDFLLELGKRLKKNRRRTQLKKQQNSNSGITKQRLIDDFKKIGLKNGDSVLVHSSMSKIGYVEGGVKTILDALFDTIGETGTLLFPAFPASGRNKDYLEEHPIFDVKNTPPN